MSAWAPTVGVVVGAQAGAAGGRVAVGAVAAVPVMVVVAVGTAVVLGRGVVVTDVSDVGVVGGAVGAVVAPGAVVAVEASVEVAGRVVTTLDTSAEAAEGLARSPAFTPQAESPATRIAPDMAVATTRCARRERSPAGGSVEVFMP